MKKVFCDFCGEELTIAESAVDTSNFSYTLDPTGVHKREVAIQVTHRVVGNGPLDLHRKCLKQIVFYSE